jgi:hypothetical protein
MDATAANGPLSAHHQGASPQATSRPSQYSLGDDDHDHDHDHDTWSAGDASTGDEAARSHSGKRKREKLSVSCETCKQRKVKCDRGHPACECESSSHHLHRALTQHTCRRMVPEEPLNLRLSAAKEAWVARRLWPGAR